MSEQLKKRDRVHIDGDPDDAGTIRSIEYDVVWDNERDEGVTPERELVLIPKGSEPTPVKEALEKIGRDVGTEPKRSSDKEMGHADGTQDKSLRG